MSAQTAAAWAVAGLLVVGAGIVGAFQTDPSTADASPPAPSPSASVSPAPEPTASPATPVETAQLAAVKLTDPCGPDLDVCGYGSGSVVDSSGLILTNAHVAAPTAPGLAGQYRNEAANPVDPPYLVVSVPPSPEADAVPLYRAEVLAADGYADLAVAKVVANADGSPLTSPPVLTNVPLGALAETKKDDEIRVIGYPESGDSLSPTVQRGTIASKPVNERVDGPWELNTAAPIHGGNSGGLVIDARGRLIAIPAYSTTDEDEVYRARAVELARPLLDAARTGRPYVSPYLVPETGKEELVEVGWSDQDVPDVCRDDVQEATSFVAPRSLDVRVILAGLAIGEDYRVVVSGPDGAPLDSLANTWDGEGCLGLFIAGSYAPLDPGTYTLTAYAGPSAELLGTSTVEVVVNGPDPEG